MIAGRGAHLRVLLFFARVDTLVLQSVLLRFPAHLQPEAKIDILTGGVESEAICSIDLIPPIHQHEVNVLHLDSSRRYVPKANRQAKLIS